MRKRGQHQSALNLRRSVYALPGINSAIDFMQLHHNMIFIDHTVQITDDLEILDLCGVYARLVTSDRPLCRQFS